MDRRLQEMVADFSQQHPQSAAHLTFMSGYPEALLRALLGDDPPDVFYVDAHSLPGLAAAGHLAPWPGPAPGADEYAPRLLQAFSLGQELYCLPLAVSPLVLFFNVALFQQAGLPVPDENWRWEELAGAAERLTNQDRDTVGMVLSADLTRWLPFHYQAGGEWITAEGTLGVETPAGSEALDFYSGLHRSGWAQRPLAFGATWNGEALSRGRVAMAVEGSWSVPYLRRQAPELAVGMVPLPAGPQGRATLSFSGCYALSARSTHGEQAYALLQLLNGPQGVAVWTDAGQAVPARRDLQAGWLAENPELKPLVDALADSRLWQPPPALSGVIQGANRDLQQVLDGAMLPEDMLNRLQVLGDRALGE